MKQRSRSHSSHTSHSKSKSTKRFGGNSRTRGLDQKVRSSNSRNKKSITTKKVPGPSPIPHKAPDEFPMRLNKYLAMNGFSTRRGADELIAKKFVTINGQIAVLGSKVEQADVVEVHNHKRPDKYGYFAYYKPRGITLDQAMSNQKSMPHVSDGKDGESKIFPLFSLDAAAEGLVILTNDARLITRVQNPKYNQMKEYLIHTVQPLRPNFQEKIEAGVTIGDAPMISSTVQIRDEHTFILRTSDNGNHVRKMCSMFFAEIQSMKRTRIMDITLGSLAANSFRKIDGEELVGFLKTLGM